MGATSGEIPNLINGISQQSQALRLPSQAESSENYYPTTVDGLTKRPRTEHLAVLDTLPEGTFTQFILRDANEKYAMAILADGTIRVWDFDGNEKTVNNTSPDYLADLTDPETEVRALTLVDYTFVLNKKKVVAAGTATEATRPFEAMVNVLAGNYGKTYRVWIDGTQAAFYTTPDGSDAAQSPSVDTSYISGLLYSSLDTAASGTAGGAMAWGGTGGYNTSPWALGRYASTLYIRNATDDFAIAVEDGYSGRAALAVKKQVQKFTDLPLYGPDGFVVEVTGTDANSFDNYWVKFVKPSDIGSTGIWQECVAPGSLLGFDGETMPHTLVREADGTFTFKAADWSDRKCGDVDSVPDPSFVGGTIEDVFFTKDRLGLLTEENMCLSEDGQFFNFYRTTLTALLDTDPIDTAASDTKVSILHHAVPFQEQLLLFSDETQFIVKSGDLLTPKTVSADPLTALDAHPIIRPESVATSIYFLAERDQWASLYEYFIDKQLENADYEDVSAHAPSYIPAGVNRLIASPTLDLVLVTTDGDPDAIYTYKFYWNGDQKLQSAWSRWRLPNVDKIMNMTFDKGKVRLLVRRGTTVHLETLTAEQSLKDIDLTYVNYLDQHTLLITGTYAAPSTTFTLPYAVPMGLKCVTAPGGSLPAGVELQPTSTGTNTVVFKGDYSTQPMRFGVPYDSRYRFSIFYQRNPKDNTADQDGRLTLSYLTIVYSNTAYFRVEVTPEARRMRTYPFNGRIIAASKNKTGELVTVDGKFSVPISSRNDRVIIEIVNDTWLPCSFSSAQWRGNWNPTNRQL